MLLVYLVYVGTSYWYRLITGYWYMFPTGSWYMLVIGCWHGLVQVYSGISHSDSVAVVSSSI